MEITWDEGALDQVLRQPGGMVGRYMNFLARSIAMEAANLTNETLERRTGRLAAGWKVMVTRSSEGAIFTVYNTTTGTGPKRAVPYSGVMEFGSAAHVIRPRDPSKWLVFWVNGHKVVTKSVKHPGTRPYNILSRAAERVMTRL